MDNEERVQRLTQAMSDSDVEVVHFTKKDRVVTVAILIFVMANFVLLLLTIPWGSLF